MSLTILNPTSSASHLPHDRLEKVAVRALLSLHRLVHALVLLNVRHILPTAKILQRAQRPPRRRCRPPLRRLPQRLAVRTVKHVPVRQEAGALLLLLPVPRLALDLDENFL